MVFPQMRFTLGDGRTIRTKSPKVKDAKNMLDHIVKVASSTDCLLSEPEDFGTKEEALIKSYHDGADYLFAAYLDNKNIGNSSLKFPSSYKGYASDKNRNRHPKRVLGFRDWNYTHERDNECEEFPFLSWEHPI